MELDVHVKVRPDIGAVLGRLGPIWRRELLSAGATAARIEIATHIRRQSRFHHKTVERLNKRTAGFTATATGHLEKGAARITSRTYPDHAVVSVPIAGISRAFRDLKIQAKKAKCLTIPLSSASYGHTVREMQRLGWTVWRVKGRDLLMGRLGNDQAQMLYTLKKQVVVKKDRNLLPSDDSMADAINGAMATAIRAALTKEVS